MPYMVVGDIDVINLSYPHLSMCGIRRRWSVQRPGERLSPARSHSGPSS